jgi:hypothetical protein
MVRCRFLWLGLCSETLSFLQNCCCHDITEILLKVALNTIKQNQTKHGSSCKTLHQTLTTKYMYIINTMFIKRKDKIDFFKPLGVKIFIISHNVVHLALIGIRTHNISCDCIGSCESNCHMITTTMALDEPCRTWKMFFILQGLVQCLTREIQWEVRDVVLYPDI